MYPSTKKNKQYLAMPPIQLPLPKTLKNLKLVYLKSDFGYLIFSQYFIASRFFLDNQDY